jgi:hypothetical protein
VNSAPLPESFGFFKASVIPPGRPGPGRLLFQQPAERRRRGPRLLFPLAPALAFGCALTGCVAESFEKGETLKFATSCPRADGADCDVRSQLCQARRFAYVMCLRETPYDDTKRPRVAFRPNVGDTFAVDPAEGRRQDLLGEGLALLGLHDADAPLSETQSDQAQDAVAGWYDPETRVITLVTPQGTDASGPELNSILSHEFVHALQDLDGTLQRRDADITTDDAALARRALTEGEAELFQWMITAVQEDLSIWNIGAWPRDHFDAEVRASAAPYAMASLIYPYTVGVERVSSIWFEHPTAWREPLEAVPAAHMADVITQRIWPARTLQAPAAQESATDAAFTSLGGVALDVAWMLGVDADLDARDPILRTMGNDRFGVYAEQSPVAVWLVEEALVGSMQRVLRTLAEGLEGAETHTALTPDGRTIGVLVVSADADLRTSYVARAVAAVEGDATALEGTRADSGRDFEPAESPACVYRPLPRTR